MKRLFTSKKAQDVEQPEVASPTLNSPTTSLPTQLKSQPTVKRRWGKKKNEETKPELDFSIALPSTDNFRTSLLMPGLSSRFSMLREQDDPSSLLGKAMDDSVLPRRSSRLLDDIAEVSSLSAPRRPPYADSERNPSYTSDGYGTDDDARSTSGSAHAGSIMSRARPGEGNVLFGGRQKIYKIPIGDAGSVNNMGSGQSRGMRGRALYEDDVSTSEFQRIRAKQREQERIRRLEEAEQQRNLSDFPSMLSYDDKRDTLSSTNSGPSTFSASTAPTSVASPVGYAPGGHAPLPSSGGASQLTSPHPTTGMERSKIGSVRRLYESKLDQHMQEQRSDNLHRLSSLQRRSSGRANSPHLLQTSGFQATSPQVESEPNSAWSRGTSPLPPSDGLTTFDSIRQKKAAPPTPSSANSAPKGVSPGVSPASGPLSDPLSQAIDAKDRGKATALGAFSRPKQPFDEQQYLQRQRSLMQQRATPPGGTPVNRSRAPSASRPPSATRDRRPSEGQSSQAGSPANSTRPSFDRTRPSIDTRFRRPTTTRADRSWSASSDKRQATTPIPGTQSPSKAGRREPGVNAPTANGSTGPARSLSNLEDRRSDVEDQLLAVSDASGPKLSFERGRPEDAPPPLRNPPSLMEHPAMRADQNKSETPLKAKRHAWNPDLRLADFKAVNLPDESEQPREQSSNEESQGEPKSIGLGLDPSSAEGLSRNMVRTHLRNISEVSSVYPNTPKTNAFDFNDVDLDVAIPSMYSETFDIWKATNTSPPPVPKIPEAKKDNGDSPSADQVDQESRYLDLPDRDAIGDSPTVPDLKPPKGLSVPGQTTEDMSEWEKELHAHHARAGSATTQAEREAFADELALRQKTIRENLRMKTDLTSRSPSPAGASSYSKPKKPFGLLRTASSRESLKLEEARARLGSQKNASSSSVDREPSQPRRGAARENAAPAVGRTLHSRMPGEESQSRRARQNSTESEMRETRNRTGSDASIERSRSRPRAPSMDHSRRQRLDTRVKAARSPVDTPQAEVHPKPSFESSRLNSNSSSERPSIASTDRSGVGSLNVQTGRAVSTSPSIEREHGVMTPLSTTSYSSMRGETNTCLAQTPLGKSAKEQDSTGPASTFNFPARKQEAKRQHHKFAQHVQKSEISEPTLISATSNVDTVELPEGATLMNGMLDDVDAVLVAQQAALASVDMMHQSSFSGPSDRGSSATVTTNSTSETGRKSPPIGGISIEKGQPPSSPPPVPHISNKRNRGFMKAFRGKEEAGRDSNEAEDFDEFVARPPISLRIRKVSDESLGGRRRHELVSAGEMEGGMI